MSLSEIQSFESSFSMCEADASLSIKPFLTSAFGQTERMCSAVFPIPLPPDVANGMTVFPEKSADSRKVSMMFGSLYHQMGKPINMMS